MGILDFNRVPDKALPARLQDEALNATYVASETLTANVAARLGYRVITDPQWAGGADPTGVADSTNAINAACAGVGFRRIYAPAGTYKYNGSGVETKHLTFKGAGAAATLFVLGAGVSLFSGNTPPTEFELADFATSGGFGAVTIRSTANAVSGHRIIRNCQFMNYTGTAILSMMNDNPYWTIENNVFAAATDQGGEVGIALLRNADVSHITRNAFLKNQIHIKLGNRGQTVKVFGNDFLRFSSAIASPNARTDIWLVPQGNGNGQLHILENKFGNENLGSQDYRVLIADEAAGTDFSTRTYSLAQSTGSTQDILLDGNQVNGASTNGSPKAFVVSTVPQTVGVQIINSIVGGSAPAAMLDVLFPAATPPGGNIVGPTSYTGALLNYTGIVTIPPCTRPGYASVVDPLGVHRSSSHNAPFPGAGWAADTSIITRKAISAYTAVGTVSQTPITDSTGGTDAATVTAAASGDRYYTGITGVVAGRPAWLEADVRLTPGAATQVTAVRVAVEESGNKSAGIGVTLGAAWRTVRVPFTPGATLPNQVTVAPHSLSASPTGQFDVGRIRVYHAAEPVNIDGIFQDMVRAPGGLVTKVKTASPAPVDADVTSPVDGVIIGHTPTGGFWGRMNGVWSRIGSTGTPSQFGGLELAAGESTIDRRAVGSSSLALTSGVMRLAYFVAQKTETINTVRVFSGGTAAASVTHAFMGVYSVDASGNLTLVGQTADDTSLFAAANTAYTKALSAPFVKTAGQMYAIGWLVTATTVPTLPGANTFGGVAVGEMSVNPRVAGSYGTGLTALPSSVPFGSVGNQAGDAYAVLTP